MMKMMNLNDRDINQSLYKLISKCGELIAFDFIIINYLDILFPLNSLELIKINNF